MGRRWPRARSRQRKTKDRLRPIPQPQPQQDGTGNAAQRPVPGGLYDFHTDQWADLYVKRIDAMIAALKTKGVPVLWVGLPALRGPKSTGDMAYLDELYRERAERAGIVYVDIWDGFVDDQGRYAVDGPDFEGQIRRLRTPDGVHFTKAGAVKLASYVDLELRRVMSNHVMPVALPEQGSPIKPGSPRPDVGPVLPLTVQQQQRRRGARRSSRRRQSTGAGHVRSARRKGIGPRCSDCRGRRPRRRLLMAASGSKRDGCRAAAGFALARRTGEEGGGRA